MNPPWGSILRAEKVPPYGGDTAWTNLVAAYEGLPQPLKDLADTLRAKHSFGALGRAVDNKSSYAQKIAENPLVAIHPVVRVHPETGERALYVSPTFTGHEREIVVGFSPRQSQRILELFWEQISRPEYTVRFRWAPGSVAFWDNRSTAHLGPSDLGHLQSGDVGVPAVVVGRDLLTELAFVAPAVDRQDLRETGRRLILMRMGRGHLPETGGERDLLTVADALVAEEDNLPAQQRLTDGGDGRVVEICSQIDPVNLGADVSSDRPDVKAHALSSGGHVCSFDEPLENVVTKGPHAVSRRAGPVSR